MTIRPKLFKFFLFAIIIVCSQMIIYFLLIDTINKNPPIANKGVLILSGWDFQTKGPVNLDGEWELYWKHLFTPQYFKDNKNRTNKLYVSVPELWNSQSLIDQKISGKGYATYRLTIQDLEKNKLYALKIPDINTSYKLWIDGKKAAYNGRVGKNKDQSTPQYLPKTIVFQSKNNSTQVIIQVSNFCYSLGGVWKSLIFGPAEQVLEIRENRKSFELFLVGTLLIMGIYHLGIYLIGKKEYAMLYFGLFCLLIVSRTLFTGERIIIELFPNFNWELALKIELLPIFVAPLIFLLFLQSLYATEINQKILRLFFYIEISGVILIFFLPPDSFELLFMTYQVLLIIISTYCFYILILAFKRKRSGAGFLIAGYIILFVAIINDVMYSQFLIQTSFFIPFGLVFFVLFAFALQKKFVQAEIDLKISKEKNQALLAALPDSMLQVNNAGIVMDHKSSSTGEIYSFKKDIEGFHLKDLLPQKIVDDFTNLIFEVIDSGQYKVIEQTVQENKKKFSFEIRAVRSENDNAIAIIRNVTDKKQAEEKAQKHQEQLIQADKMVALGTLVTGIAHEINNPNNAIILTTEVLAETWKNILPIIDEYVAENGEIELGGRPYVEWRDTMPNDFLRIIRNSERIKNIVADLKTYSRKDTSQLNEEIDLNKVVESSLNILKDKIKQSTNYFSVVYGDSLPIIKGSFQKLEQVIINLVLNACQALRSNQEKITISTAYDSKAKQVICTIIDEGIGMNSETLKSIFDPFFTTKTDSKGTGLGLSISAGIVKKHLGSLDFESEPGQGTSAKLILNINS